MPLRLVCGVYMRVLALSLCLLVSAPRVSIAELVINEFMADNVSTTNDPQGQSADWIEIYNTGGTPVDIGGMYITDDLTDTTKYRIPTTNSSLTTVSAGGHLLLWADNDSEDGILHLEIKLDANGEEIGLFDTDGVTEIDSIVFGPQAEDASFGRYPDGAVNWYAMSDPTPDAVNQAGMANATLISPEGMTFTNEISISLSASNATRIYYTTDGSLPTTNSLEYSGTITTNASIQVRAAAYEPGLVLGAISSESFIKLNSDVLSYSSDLPIVIVDNFGAGDIPVQDALGTRQFAYLGVFEPTNGVSSLTNMPHTSCRSGITRRGESSLRATDRRPNLSVETWGEAEDADANVSLLDMPSESDWILYRPLGYSGTDGWDDAGVRNTLIFELSNQAGRYAVRTRFVAVFLNYNGGPLSAADFNGVYVLMERIKKDDDRVDVETLGPEDASEPDITGGYMFKIDKTDPDAVSFSAGGHSYYWVYPRGDEMTGTMTVQADWLKSYINEYDAALDGPDYQNPTNGYARYIDVDSWIDHNLLNMMTKNVDGLRLSTYLHKKRSQKIEMGPIWDFDRSMESTDGRDNQWNTWYSSNGDSPYFDYGQWARLFTDANFQQKYVDRWWYLRQNVFSFTNVMAVIDQHTNTMHETQVYDPLADPAAWETRVDRMVNWVSNRLEWIDGQLIASPEFSLAGGLVTNGYELVINWPTNAVDRYYTLDGNDPRAEGGGVTPGAQLYTGPITVTENTIVKARAHNASWSMNDSAGRGWGNAPWGGPAEAIFIVTQPEFAITEIMYHPRNPEAGTSETNYTTSDFEYIELQNVGAETHSLLGVEFTDGVEFDFTYGGVTNIAPGDFVLVVNNLAAFASRHTNWAAMKIAGEYDLDLSSAGENLRLMSPIGVELLEFEYGDGRGWPLAADGAGHSLVPLVLSNQTSDLLRYGGNWRASAYIDGSPGEVDPAPITDMVINELMAHTDYSDPGLPWLESDDWVEVYNTSSSAVSLADWYLSDSVDNLKKWQVEPTNALASNGWVTFSESQHFHTNELSGFGLDKDGETLFLSYLPGTAQDRVGDAVRFKGQENDVTLGRYADGGDYLYALSPTANSANAAPSSHVVIGELMIHPQPTSDNPEDNTHDEYIKLFNPLDSQVDLWTDAGPWRIDGGVDFVLPAAVSLAANGSLLIVSFDPSDTNELNVFASAYGITNAESMTILGPYDGKLSNWGERIALERPQAPDVIGEGPSWVIVDEVIYSTSSPWPAEVQTNGLSLQRTSILESGNDPDSWSALGANPTVPIAKIAIIDPVAGGTTLVPSSLTVAAFVDEGQVNGTVHYVEFFLDGTNSLGVDATPPYEVVADYYDISAAGDYRLRAEMVDDGGTNSSIEIEVHAVWADRIEITEPYEGDSLLTPFVATFAAEVLPAHVVGTVTNVTFYDGTNVLAIDNSVPYSCEISQHNLLPGMVHELTAVMNDAFGPSTSEVVSVYVYDSIFKDWDYRMPVSVSGYANSQGLENFPVLIKLQEGLEGFDYDQVASASGGDLRVADVTGTNILYHEVESWDPGGISCVWVQMPQLPEDGASIWIYWGNDSATDPPAYATNGTVWANGFGLVQHMADDTGSTTVSDSTSNDVQSTFRSSYTWEETGQIGRALGLPAIGSAVQVADPYVPLAESWTISTWFKGLYPTSQGRTLARTFSGDRAAIVNKTSDDLGVQTGLDFIDSGYDLPAGNTQWHHIAAVGEGGVTLFYLNGKIVGSASNQVSGSIQYIANTFSLFGGECFAEYIDEFRIDSVARSSNWIWTCWMNQGSNDLFNTYGSSEENNPLVEVPLDVDGDGMMDLWEIEHFGSTNAPEGIATNDPDKDGLNNDDEFTAGTNPTNSNSVFWVDVNLSNGAALVEFFGVDASGYGGGYQRYYSLENATNLEGGWSGVPDYTNLPGEDRMIVYSNSPGGFGPLYFRGQVWLVE